MRDDQELHIWVGVGGVCYCFLFRGIDGFVGGFVLSRRARPDILHKALSYFLSCFLFFLHPTGTYTCNAVLRAHRMRRGGYGNFGNGMMGWINAVNGWAVDGISFCCILLACRELYTRFGFAFFFFFPGEDFSFAKRCGLLLYSGFIAPFLYSSLEIEAGLIPR